MATYVVEKDHGCGFLGRLVQRRSLCARKASIRLLPSAATEPASYKKGQDSNQSELIKSPPKCARDKPLGSKKMMVASPRTSISSSSTISSTTPRATHHQGQDRHLALLYNHHHGVPASSGNITRLVQISNLKQPRTSPLGSPSTKALQYPTMGNILRRKSSSDEDGHQGFMCRLDGELLKSRGNDMYKQGKYEDALALYDQAIFLDPNQASYRGNKGAALMCLGRILEAVSECREAVRIQPSYHRAHYRLATLYARLGCAEKALYHFKCSGSLADFKEISQAQALQTYLRRCNEAKNSKDWSSLLRQTSWALSAGADSAPQVYALQVEALLNLHRHEEAYAAYKQGPNFSMDRYTQIFCQAEVIGLCLIQARVYMAAGRFEDAIKAAQHALQLNPADKEARALFVRTRAVAVARARGNKHYGHSEFTEASSAYSEGLDHDPYNSILLANRAACRSKLGLFEKAMEDCTQALSLQPSYRKARLRRANCNAMLERWEASIQDYEVLMRETPGDEMVGRALFEARIQLKKQQGHDVKDMEFGSNLILVSSKECFRNYITLPGMSVVLFSNKTSNGTVQLLEPVRKRFPSINFLKVEVESHPYLAKSEAVSDIPVFKIFKNGSRVNEVPGNNLELLERSVKLYSN